MHATTPHLQKDASGVWEQPLKGGKNEINIFSLFDRQRGGGVENGVWLELEVLTEIVIGVMAKVSGGDKVVLTCYGHWTCTLSPLNVSFSNKLGHFYLSFTRHFFLVYAPSRG